MCEYPVEDINVGQDGGEHTFAADFKDFQPSADKGVGGGFYPVLKVVNFFFQTVGEPEGASHCCCVCA